MDRERMTRYSIHARAYLYSIRNTELSPLASLLMQIRKLVEFTELFCIVTNIENTPNCVLNDWRNHDVWLRIEVCTDNIDLSIRKYGDTRLPDEFTHLWALNRQWFQRMCNANYHSTQPDRVAALMYFCAEFFLWSICPESTRPDELHEQYRAIGRRLGRKVFQKGQGFQSTYHNLIINIVNF